MATGLSLSRLFATPPVAPNLQLSTSPPLRVFFPPLTRVFHRLRNSVPRFLITRAAESTAKGFWEEPDDGFGSEGDESEDEDNGREQTETSYGGAINANHSKSDYDRLVKEVEQLLEPEEKDILQQNAVPDISKISTVGATALHYAVQAGAMQTVKLLIKYKVDVNAVDNDGWTPLHISMQSRSRDIAKVLLVNGADKTRRNKDGKTPLDLSLCYGRDFKSYDLAKLLKLVPANRNP